MELKVKYSEVYDYCESLFKGVCELNNYKYITVPTTTDLNSIDSEEQKYYLTKSMIESDIEKKIFIASVKDNSSFYIDAELINICIKYLAVLKIYNPYVLIADDNESKELLESLEFECEVEKINKPYEIKVKDKVIAYIEKSSNKTTLIIDYDNLESIIESDNLFPISDDLELYVIPESSEQYSDALIIGTMCKDAGYKTEIDYNKVDTNKKGNRAVKMNATYIIYIGKKEQESYSVILEDIKTKEKKNVGINNLVDELDMNF